MVLLVKGAGCYSVTDSDSKKVDVTSVNVLIEKSNNW